MPEHGASTACGFIRPSKSPFTSPFFFIKKKDCKLQPIQDYRKLNDLTVKNQYPLPLIADVVEKLKNAKIFTKFDIHWGYNNVHIKEGDKWKAAFKTNRGMFEPLVMFFSLANSAATFQSMMNSIFGDLIATGKVFIYTDDILISTTTLEEHCILVRQVLQCLLDHHLFLKPEKCEFETNNIEYLGLRLRPGHIAMDPIKLRGIADWPIPQNLRIFEPSSNSQDFIDVSSAIFPAFHVLSTTSPKRTSLGTGGLLNNKPSKP
jgi:Reverse transcriptase (RNA-dependent DNA polymerase)